MIYWRDPIHVGVSGWRRWLDIITVQICLWHSMYQAWGAENCHAYYTLIASGGVSWLTSLIAKDAWHEIYWHGMIHIFGSLANFTLLSGRVN